MKHCERDSARNENLVRMYRYSTSMTLAELAAFSIAHHGDHAVRDVGHLSRIIRAAGANRHGPAIRKPRKKRAPRPPREKPSARLVRENDRLRHDNDLLRRRLAGLRRRMAHHQTFTEAA